MMRNTAFDSRYRLSRQQEEFRKIYEQLKFLATIEHYNPTKRTCSQDGYFLKIKVTRDEYDKELAEFLDSFEKNDPISMCMLSRYFVMECNPKKVAKYSSKVMHFKHQLFVADGEEEVHIPDKIRRLFRIYEKVITGRVLQQFAGLFSRERERQPQPPVPQPVQGIPLETDGALSDVESPTRLSSQTSFAAAAARYDSVAQIQARLQAQMQRNLIDMPVRENSTSSSTSANSSESVSLQQPANANPGTSDHQNQPQMRPPSGYQASHASSDSTPIDQVASDVAMEPLSPGRITRSLAHLRSPSESSSTPPRASPSPAVTHGSDDHLDAAARNTPTASSRSIPSPRIISPRVDSHRTPTSHSSTSSSAPRSPNPASPNLRPRAKHSGTSGTNSSSTTNSRPVSTYQS